MADEPDHYDLLGIDISASSKVIAKSYRLKALTCHPDKVGPDDTQAAALFLALTNAYDILSDPGKRAIYDGKYKAKLERLRKKGAMNAESRKMRDELEARERAAKKSRTVDADAEAATREEIERLREAGLARLREHERALAEAAVRAQQCANKDTSSSGCNKSQELDAALMVKWNPNVMQPDEEELTRIFEKYGPIEHVVLRSKRGRAVKAAVVAFVDVRGAVVATMDASLASTYEISWVSGQEPPGAASIRLSQRTQEAAIRAAKTYQQSIPTASAPAFAAGAFSDSMKLTNATSHGNDSKKIDDFEDMILQQMMAKK
ncbi:hypothetical protein SeMB42_g04531 [Synchytrium endobioticum]|uniref:J domain-containing protein n=1 Tax=Synchytrium endobioticum TaxID=286115 RepID=A0A507CXV5_9FUNG|nr:hypothetical protein SeMB42_g04531 [Synchytrium endobioticum]TPX46116.1 hypothetical protein SeLEV6574_g03415 [Synchytrium endobioticum]